MLFTEGVQAVDQTGVCVRLIEGKKHLIFLLTELILKGKAEIILILMMWS